MSTPVSQGYKEFNSLADKIAAKYDQLDSLELGAVGTPGFNAKSVGLSLFQRVISKKTTIQKINSKKFLIQSFKPKSFLIWSLVKIWITWYRLVQIST